MRTCNQRCMAVIASLMLVVTFFVSGASCQIQLGVKDNASIMRGSYITADRATVSENGDRVSIFAQGADLDEAKSFVAVVVPYEKCWVLANEVSKPFPTRYLTRVDDVYPLTDPGVYIITVLPIVDGVPSAPEIIEDVIVGETPTPAPDPVEPEPDDFSALTAKANQLVKSINDPDRALFYANNLSAIDWTGSLEEVKVRVGKARQDSFRGEIKGDWYKFLVPMDQELGKAQTLDEYSGMWQAILSGIREHLSMYYRYTDTSDWEPPSNVGPSDEGMVYNGRIYTKVCNGTSCEFVWKPYNP